MPQRIVLIGSDAPGLDALQRHLRDHPDAQATVLLPEDSPFPEPTCSILDRCMQQGIHFPEQTRACGVDRGAKRVKVRDVASGTESFLGYDTLVFATGAAPRALDVPGDHLPGIVRVGSHEDAARLHPVQGTAVVVGDGANLLLAVSALMHHETPRIEAVLLPERDDDAPLSPNLAAMVRHHLTQAGVVFHEGQPPRRLERRQGGLRLHLDGAALEADCLVNATANEPVTAIAREAGIETSPAGAILVDTALRTGDPDIFACGGCATFVNPVCRKPVPGVAVRFTERRQATALAAALGGKDARLAPPVNVYSVDLGGLSVAGAGLTREAARTCGYEAKSATVVQQDRAHFMPGVELMTLELVFDAASRRVLGIQGIGRSSDALRGRIGTVAAILPKKPLVEDVAHLEVGYAPPFASAMDVLNTVGNVADNILAGANEGIGVDQFQRRWARRGETDDFFLDCREIGNARPLLERHPEHWNHIPQGELAARIDEVPKDRTIVLVCNTGARSYEAQVLLKHAGHHSVVNVDGGMAAIRQRGIKL